MKCTNCGSENCQIINETTSTGKDFSASKGCCGAVIFGPMGLLCGLCGKGRQIHNKQYWICNNCGNKWSL